VSYVSLHTHSTFSLLDGYGTPEMLVARAKELGHTALALTDHGNTSGHVQLEKAARAAGIKPIYGCEFYLTESVRENQRIKCHITVLAKNPVGYRNLLQLASLAYTEGHFYYQPTVDMHDLEQHAEGLVVLSGCLAGYASRGFLTGQDQTAMEYLQWGQKTFCDFYVEVQPLELEDSQKAMVALVGAASKLGIPLVATNDVHYVRLEDRETQCFLAMVRRKLTTADEWGMLSPRCYLASEEDMLAWGGPTEAVLNTQAIADMCEDFRLPRAEPVKYPGVKDAYELLLQLCREGWKRRGVPKEHRATYGDRVKYELEMIRAKDFTDYFLVVADMVKWAKSQNILVGPARGSAAGSLVAYLIGITEVDPIKWDLLFERFIDPSRPDPPDIDLDFQHDRRDEVKEYLRLKYGADRVTNIAGYSTFKGKGLLDDLGRVYRIPKRLVEEAKADLIEEGGSKTVEEVITERWPNLVHVAKAEGMIRQLTVHAAGVVVATNRLDEYTTIGHDGIMLDYRDAGELGLLKIDVLSLTTLTIIGKVLEAIGQAPSWLYTLPLDDPDTIKAFAGDKFHGVFQYAGGATKGICQQLAPQDFQTLIDINALSRPGPLRSGATKAYINGWSDDIHPVVTKWTARSRGQILYQEQIMRILKDAGNLEWADVNAVRKLITKKQGVEKLVGIKARFMQAFEAKPELGEEIWKRCGESGAYGFNISHSTSYTFLGYYCMFLKAHYPLEFYWANLAVEPDNVSLLREFVLGGGKVLGVNWPKSRAGWSIDNGCLRAGYLTLRGIGPKSAEKLEAGEEPTGRTKTILAEAGALCEAVCEVPVDYFGYENLTKTLEAIDSRDKIGNIKPGDFVHIAGVITKFEVKNLRELYKTQGKDYEAEVSEPEKETYVNLVLADETGDIMVTVNRYMCADPLLWMQLTERKERDIFEARGERTKDYIKVRAIRIKNWSLENDPGRH
jgi:DNA polymerase-3 subunit alpha